MDSSLFESILLAKNILLNLKGKVAPLAELPQHYKSSSEQMEINFFKEKINELHAENNLLIQNLSDCLKVIEYLSNKIEELNKNKRILEDILIKMDQKINRVTEENVIPLFFVLFKNIFICFFAMNIKQTNCQKNQNK